MPLPIIVVLFEHGEFQRPAAEATAAALAAFGLGLPSFVLVKVLQPAFFAREDTKTPFQITVVSVIANIVLGLVLFQVLRHVGLALATSLAMWLNTGLLILSLRAPQFLLARRAREDPAAPYRLGQRDHGRRALAGAKSYRRLVRRRPAATHSRTRVARQAAGVLLYGAGRAAVRSRTYRRNQGELQARLTAGG